MAHSKPWEIRSSFLPLVVLFCSAFSPLLAGEDGGRLIDLTYSFSRESVYWPTADGFKWTVDSKGVTEQGYYYMAGSFGAAEHGGTHIDAPAHFAANKPTVDEVDLTRLIGPGVLVDVTASTSKDSDYQITVADLKGWELTHGPLPEDVILLLRTGWGRFYPDPTAYLGTADRGESAVANLHFPGLSPDAAEWLVKNRSIAAIGIDTPSIDFGQSRLFRSHQILFRQSIPAFENVASLEQLPEKGFRVIALPMKIKGGSGGPLRIVAVLEDLD